MITKRLAHLIEEQPSSNLSYGGIDFFDVQVNQILLQQTLGILKGKKSPKKSVDYGVLNYALSRVGYRLFKFGSDIGDDAAFRFEAQRICDTGFYTNSGWFQYEGRYYMIANSLADRSAAIAIMTNQKISDILK